MAVLALVKAGLASRYTWGVKFSDGSEFMRHAGLRAEGHVRQGGENQRIPDARPISLASWVPKNAGLAGVFSPREGVASAV